MLQRIWHYQLNRWQVWLLFVLFLIAEYFVFGMNLVAPLVSIIGLLVLGGIPYSATAGSPLKLMHYRRFRFS